MFRRSYSQATPTITTAHRSYTVMPRQFVFVLFNDLFRLISEYCALVASPHLLVFAD